MDHYKKDPLSASLQKERFDRLIAEVEDYAIILLSPEGTILSWNLGAEKIKGYTPDEIIGRNYTLFYPKEDKNKGLAQDLLREAIEKGKVTHECWHIRKDGSRFWGSITLNALHDDEGNVSGIINLTRDLTDKKIAEDKLGNIIEELRLKNEELSSSEDRYHKMMSEVLDYAIILLDPEGKILEWNKGAEKLKGYKPKEIIGKSFRLFYTLEDKNDNLPQRLLNEAREKGYVTHEGYRIRKDGTRFWGSVAITAIHDDEGKITGFSKVTKDLTDRKFADDKVAMITHELKQTNEELKRSEERYHKMISEVQDYAIILLNKDGEIQNWNTGAEYIKGYRADEIIGKNFRVFYMQEDIESKLPDRLLQQAIINGKATSEGWRLRKDGSKFWGSIVITALHDSEGEIIGFSKVTRDLTEKKNAEDMLKQNARDLELKNIALEKLNEELSSFAYVVSHDLKEPIRKIQVFADRQLEPGKSQEQIQEFSHKILSSASRMQKLMEALLSYSHISSELRDLESVDLNEILNAVKNDLELSISTTEAQVISGKLPVVKGIGFQLHQMFLNLISNSIKFSRKSEKPKINIESTLAAKEKLPDELAIKNQPYHLITFIDNGIGFEPEHSGRIFEVFQRLTPVENTSGMGIGLSIVKKVIQNHEGVIIAEGKPNVGAKFRIFLPA